MEHSAGVRPLPPKNISLRFKGRPLDADGNFVEMQLLPNQAFEAAVLWRAAHAAQRPSKCANSGCTKQIYDRVEGGVQMQRVFCRRCEVTDASCARVRPLSRYQTRASRPRQCLATDDEVLDFARLRDEFCGDLGRYKQVLEAESVRRQAADAAHAVKATRLAAAGRCAEQGCTMPQAFGLTGSNKTEFCRDHKKEGMMNLCKVARCRQKWCNRKPFFGVEGSRMGEFCGFHKKEGMVNEVNNKCSYSGCTKAASFGFHTGKKHAEICSQHARAGMVGVVSGKRKRGRTTDLVCALTGASTNGGKKRSSRVGLLQRMSPIQPDTAVKKEIDESCPSTSDSRKGAPRVRERLRRNSLTHMGGW